MATDRDTFGHKDENYCAKEHGFVGDTHLPCIKTAGTLKSFKTVMPTG